MDAQTNPAKSMPWFNAANLRRRVGLITLGLVASGLVLNGSRSLVVAAPPAPEKAVGAGVQIDISTLLNARVIITAKDGRPQFADHSLDNAPRSILITASAAAATHAEKIVPLIDSAFFAANDRHPDVQLPYGKAGDGPQVYRSKESTETLQIPVPADHYAQMQLFLISSMGATPLTVTLKYADGTSDPRKLIIPDWFLKPKADDAGSFALADNFGKVDMKGKTIEHDHHYIRGFNLDPDKSKALKQMEITKNPSKTVLTLFGITGALDPHAGPPSN